jgi:hypothetical protein
VRVVVRVVVRIVLRMVVRMIVRMVVRVCVRMHVPGAVGVDVLVFMLVGVDAVDLHLVAAAAAGGAHGRSP